MSKIPPYQYQTTSQLLQLFGSHLPLFNCCDKIINFKILKLIPENINIFAAVNLHAKIRQY